MNNGLAHQTSQENGFLPSANDTGLRLALEEARQLAAQSKLLALNSALESANACRDPGETEEMDALVGSANQAIAEAEMITAAVERLLLQMQSSPSISGAL
jgi:hypothetical protein